MKLTSIELVRIGLPLLSPFRTSFGTLTLPGDTSASDRYYSQDITAPFLLEDGHLTVPTGPGIGVEPHPDVLASMLTSREQLSLA